MFSRVFVAVLFIAITSGKPKASADIDHHKLELRQHYEHLAFIAEFSCHEPQPKVIPVHKLFPSSQTHGKAYFPDVTVLSRCDTCTGVCTSGHVCAPFKTVQVLLPFKVTFLQDLGQHKKGSWNMEYHELTNHTQCACVPEPPTEDSHSYINPELIRSSQ